MKIDLKNQNTTIVIFGITGDLVQKKVIPAIFNLWIKKLLPRDIKIVGFSRREINDTQIRDILIQNLPLKIEEKIKKEFINKVFYKQGFFDSLKDYTSLLNYLNEIDKKAGICAHKLFYLAVPPHLYKVILENIYKSGLHIHCAQKKEQTKILIEKPFGNDLKSAKSLDLFISKHFDDDQIYKIDHYLGKEILQNILFFRFSNVIFDPIFNNKYVEKIEINLFEKNDVSNRGNFYNSVGAIKDVGQNHMLAMLSLILLENPKIFNAKNIRKERENVVSKIFIKDKKDFLLNAIKAQYTDFSNEIGVLNGSQTETFFRFKLFLKNKRWFNVPIFLSSGKALDKSITEIKIYFRNKNNLNQINFIIQPENKIEIIFNMKSSGFAHEIESKNMFFDYENFDLKSPDAYEKILFDAITGDQTIFPTKKEIIKQWQITEEVLDLFKSIPLKKYKRGTAPDLIN